MAERDDAIAQLRPVLEAEGAVRWAYLFGSLARGESGRDVDVAVFAHRGSFPTAVAWGSLIARLEAAVGSAVDLVDLERAPLHLLGAILAERVLLVDREPVARRAWEADSMSRWIDFRPAWERFARVRREALERRTRGVSG